MKGAMTSRVLLRDQNSSFLNGSGAYSSQKENGRFETPVQNISNSNFFT